MEGLLKFGFEDDNYSYKEYLKLRYTRSIRKIITMYGVTDEIAISKVSMHMEYIFDELYAENVQLKESVPETLRIFEEVVSTHVIKKLVENNQ